ncbi:peptidylprolyl isomerase [Kumtagia ephedrae]|uniref:Parvulin-like PPIase n=1 Tax=Kumtagia ephedrae TaxID=2116701 RepID=A0A2P7SGU3_9HYPH|nr:peptidylprolyl isomerase [Mesorhizobium ephedrae]PSJ61703.1 peptidylprolyl isomerase [Mesorhizobium ephedrae]
MLETLRTAAGTWIAKLLLLLLVLSFAVWGISGQIGNGIGGNSVVTAGATSVSPNEYRLAYDRQLGLLSQRFGQRLTREQATALGVDNLVLSQLVSGALLSEQARKLGLGLSKDRIAALTAEDPAFQGPDGRFSRQQFDYVLREVGMRPEDYLTNRAQEAVREQIIDAVAEGMKAPDAFLRALALYSGEDRTVDYLSLPRSTVGPVPAPDDAALSAWFDERKQQYAAPEYRKIAYVKLEPEDIADESAISDEQVRADYEKNKTRYTTAETRTIEQLVFPSRAAADEAAAALQGGTPFDKVVEAQGKTLADVHLGTLAKDRVPDRAVAEAAFTLGANEVSPVVDGSFGAVLVRVTAINPETVRSYEDVAPEIRKDLALGEAHRVLLDVHDSYEDARAGGETLAEAASKLKLAVVTIDAVDQTGRRPDGMVLADLPASSELLRGAFDTEVGVENQAINIGSDGYVFYEVQGITPARDRALDEVKDKVIADWTAAETDKRLSDKVAELEKRLKDGTPFDTIAGELALEKQTKRGLKRGADDADFGSAGVEAAFDVAQGGSGAFAAPTGDARILFQVTEVFEPAASSPDAVLEAERRNHSTGLVNDMLDQLVARLEGEYPVRVDQAAMARALAF